MEKVVALCPVMSVEPNSLGCPYKGMIRLSDEVKHMDRQTQRQIKGAAIERLNRFLKKQHEDGKHNGL